MQVSTLTILDRQGAAERIPAPSPETTRARLLSAIQQRPAPQPAAKEPTLLDVAEWQRRSRGLQAPALLRSIRDTRNIAGALGVTARTVNYWRRGEHAPTPRHWVQLRALRAIINRI
jgi:hypothetical protein